MTLSRLSREQRAIALTTKLCPRLEPPMPPQQMIPVIVILLGCVMATVFAVIGWAP